MTEHIAMLMTTLTHAAWLIPLVAGVWMGIRYGSSAAIGVLIIGVLGAVFSSAIGWQENMITPFVFCAIGISASLVVRQSYKVLSNR